MVPVCSPLWKEKWLRHFLFHGLIVLGFAGSPPTYDRCQTGIPLPGDRIRSHPALGLLLALFFLMHLCILGGAPAAHAEDQLFLDTQKLAEQGDSEAQFSLGLMYDTGDIGNRDHGQAVYWFTRAAKAGIAGACLYLGMKYEFGVQVTQNSTKAQHWYEQAALQGWGQAAFMLANLHFNATPARQIAGCAWMTIARDQDFPGADQFLQQHCLDLSADKAGTYARLAAELKKKIYPAESPPASR